MNCCGMMDIFSSDLSVSDALQLEQVRDSKMLSYMVSMALIKQLAMVCEWGGWRGVKGMWRGVKGWVKGCGRGDPVIDIDPKSLHYTAKGPPLSWTYHSFFGTHVTSCRATRKLCQLSGYNWCKLFH